MKGHCSGDVLVLSHCKGHLNATVLINAVSDDAKMKLSSWRRLILFGNTWPKANNSDLKEYRRERQWRQWFFHSARTALAAVLSLYVAHSLRFPEAYWAAISTLIVMQSTVDATFKTSV